MKLDRIKVALVAVAIMGMALAGPAQAVYVSYTVAGSGPMFFPGPVTPPGNAPWGVNGYPGDTIELKAHTGLLNLVVGSYVQKINTLSWTIDYTYAGTATDPTAWSNLAFPVPVSRNMSLDGGPAGALSQTGLLEVTWDNDFLSFSAGSATSFLAQGYQVDVTPLAVSRVGGSNFDGSNPWIQPDRDIMARFDVSVAEVPEPSTMVLGALLLSFVGACRVRSIRGRRA
jgi:hypothetical protein